MEKDSTAASISIIEAIQRAREILDNNEPSGPVVLVLTRRERVIFGAHQEWLQQCKRGETITLDDGTTIYLLD